MLVRLEEIAKTTPGVGKKAKRLAILLNNGFSIPDGFVISSDEFSPCFSEILKELDRADENIIMKSSRLQALFAGISLPSNVESDAAHQYLEMEIIPNLPQSAARFITAGRDIPVAAVRLSGESELPFVHAILNIYGQKQLLFSIKKVLSSLLSAQNIDFAKKKHFSSQQLLNNGIIIQKFIPGEIFGMVMKHPNKPGYLVEYSEAQNFFNSMMYGSSDAKRIEVSDMGEQPVLEGKYSVGKMIENLKKAEELLGEPIALEWCIARDRIYILDAKPSGKSAPNINGKAKKTLSTIGPDDVVILENCNSEFFPIPERLSGIICNHGSYSSSLANYCRQLGIPFFIEDASSIEDGQQISIANGILQTAQMPEQSTEQPLESKPLFRPVSNIIQAIKQRASPQAPVQMPSFDNRITKVGVLLQPKKVFTESNSIPCYDEVILIDRDYLSFFGNTDKPVSYLVKDESEIEELKNFSAKMPSLRLLFDNMENEVIEKARAAIPNSTVGFIIKTPYDMLKVKELQPFADLAIYDLGSIVKLMINRESDNIDDSILKQVRNSMRLSKEKGMECYCCNFISNSSVDSDLLKKLILIGADGVVVKENECQTVSAALEATEKKILLDLARKAFQI